MFFRGSRYEHIAEATITDGRGVIRRYKRMRFIPAVEPVQGDIVRLGDRPDLIAYRTLGDPEQFWRLADVNRVLKPADLSAAPGRRIGVPGPGGPR